MKDLIIYIAKALVDNPEEVVVTEVKYRNSILLPALLFMESAM